MPIKDGVVYIDNTYLKDVSICSTRAYILRILGLKSVESNLDAANAGTCFHKGVERYVQTDGNRAEAMEAFLEAYDGFFPPEEGAWAGIVLKTGTFARTTPEEINLHEPS